MCFFLGQVSKKVQRAVAAVLAKRSIGRKLEKVLNGECPVFFVVQMRKRMRIDEARVFGGDLRVVLVKYRFISKGFYPNLVTYNEGLNALRDGRTERCVLLE